MALPLLTNMVKNRLPYLVDDDATDALISGKALELYYEMQKQTLKTDEQVEQEDSYSNLQRLFFADYVAYEMLKRRIMEKATGTAGTEADAPAFLKRAKADVVETEFEQIKGAVYSSSDLLDLLKTSVCAKAQQLHYDVPVCVDSDGGASGYPGKFRFIPRYR